AKVYGDYRGRKCYEYFMGNASICNGCGVSIALQTKKITVTEEILFKENNRHIQVTSIPFQDSKSGEWLAAEVNVDITDRKLLEDNLKENWDIQNSINQILKISLEEMKLENILEKILDIIFQTKYIRDFYKCSIFLTDRTKPGLLFLKASRNALDNKTFQNCELLEFGKCLCGKCAAEKKMIYKSSMDEDHYFKMEGAFDHAHYCFPILNKDDAKGVLNFVIPKNTEIQESQIQFLFAVSDIISNIVTGKWNDEELALKTNLTQKYAKEIQESYMMLKQTQQQLILSDKMAAIGTLSAGIAHEINNPVAYIKGNIITLEKYMNGMLKLINEFLSLSNNNSFGAELKKLAAESDLNFISSDIPELIKETKEGVEKVITIVKSMKSFIRKGKDGIEKADINKILENSLVIAKSQIKNKIRIEKKLAVLPEIPCYSNQIEQVFLNLIINSVQAIGKEGIIKIETFAENDKIIIKIQDTGSGIPAHLINKIFEPFFTTKEVGKGTGLGLSIVYDIISNHGGEITVESKPDEGTVFKISLPTHNVAKKKRILIVEDNENIKGLLFDLLKTTYNVKCACDGFEAGKLVYDFIPDAILLDIMLPGINGMDICEMLRKDAVFKNIIIIAVTASIHTDAEFFKAGFNAVIRKPFSIEEILKTLEKLLE
ncbi:MAG TPA: ATP-binding protein, partial [bacterium]|nr:ATP-binding protein [bacterium]